MTATRHLSPVPAPAPEAVSLPLLLPVRSTRTPLLAVVGSAPSQCELCDGDRAVQWWLPDAEGMRRRAGHHVRDCPHCTGWLPSPAA